MKSVLCPYCGCRAELVDGEAIYGSSRYPGRYWLCRPCSAWVGTHKNSPTHAPLGRLANAELRAAKMMAHAAFDLLWTGGSMSRSDAYAWLADSMGMTRGRCHIGWMDVEECRRVASVCNAEFKRLGKVA